MRFSFFDKLNICTVSVPFLLGNRASSVIYTADPTMMSKKSKNWVLSSFLLHPKSTPAFSTVWFSPWRIWHPGGLSLQQWIWSRWPLTAAEDLASRWPLTAAEDLASRWPLTAAEDLESRWPLTAAEDLASRWPLTAAEDPAANWPLSHFSRGSGGQMASHCSRGSGGQVASDCSRRFGCQMASHNSRGSGGQVASDCSRHPQKVPLYRTQSKPLCTMLYAPLYTHPFHTSCQCCIHSTHSIAHLSWVKKLKNANLLVTMSMLMNQYHVHSVCWENPRPP